MHGCISQEPRGLIDRSFNESKESRQTCARARSKRWKKLLDGAWRFSRVNGFFKAFYFKVLKPRFTCVCSFSWVMVTVELTYAANRASFIYIALHKQIGFPGASSSIGICQDASRQSGARFWQEVAGDVGFLRVFWPSRSSLYFMFPSFTVLQYTVFLLPSLCIYRICMMNFTVHATAVFCNYLDLHGLPQHKSCQN